MIAKLTIRNLQANMGRFTMTTFGVVLAVSFVVSAFVLGDGLRKTFNDLSTEIVAGTDLEIRPVEEFGSVASLSDSDVDTVLDVEGVAAAAGVVEAPENSVRPIPGNGEQIPTTGPPQLAFNWIDGSGFSPFALIEGEPPGQDEFVIDIDSADQYGFDVGQSYVVVTSTGRHSLVLSGLTRFGEDNATLGAVLMAMNTEQTGELFGTVGYGSIAAALTDSGRADVATTQERVEQAVPDLDVLNQTTLADETSAEFNTQITLIQSLLLAFAGVALLVSTFIIGNTFAIVLQQRTREMGLLRLVGADARQLRRGALGEAVFIGAIASAIGIPGGVGVAAGLTSLFGAIGAELPDYDIIVSVRTIGVALAVGIGVTLVSAWWPTRTATRIPALAALQSGTAGTEPSGRTRTIAGLIMGALGAIVALAGVLSTSSVGTISGGSASTTTTLTLMATGAIAIFIAITLISPRLVTPLTAGFALALERFGMAGRLAVRNSRRQAGRTATTATALMIGLAVVSMALVVGQSIKTQIGSDIEETVAADYLLTSQVPDARFPSSIIEEIEADPAFGAVTGFRTSEMDVADEIVEVTAARLDDLPELIDIEISRGAIASNGNQVLVRQVTAEANGLEVGDMVPVIMNNGARADLEINALFEGEAVIRSDWLVDVSFFDSNGVAADESWIVFNLAPELEQSEADAAVAQIQSRYPQGELETSSQFQKRMEGLIDQILSVLNILVALAVLIALIGIANTLALAVSERTREIGLLRGVGMTSRGVRRMIRYEAAVIAAFGAVLGVAMGVGLGWLAVVALPATFADQLAIPVGQILILVLVAAIAGVLAALLPARRAGRMNVLGAITS